MILWYAACTAGIIDPDTDPTDTTDTRETDVDTDIAIVDIDADGARSDVDCDDYDPTVHPGASEVWNSTDDDCDGVIDADGTYTGVATVDATAIYEGTPYSWRLSCPTTLVRHDQSFSFGVICTSNQDDAMMVLLLGDRMEVHEIENIVVETAFSGSMRVSSTDGWDSNGSATLKWADFSKTDLAFSMNTTSLDLSGRARLTR